MGIISQNDSEGGQRKWIGTKLSTDAINDDQWWKQRKGKESS